MNPTELYEEVVREFPPMWPQAPEWEWVNVHDGKAPKLDAISDLLERCISSSDVIVVVHSEPGTAVKLSKASAANYMAGHVLEHEVQASDPVFTCFVSVSRTGVATGCNHASHKPV
jgi:hypothetical protein